MPPTPTNWNEKPDHDRVILAHDMLVAIMLGETPLKGPGRHAQAASLAASVLCWVLGHQHNTTFSTLLSALEAEVHKAGGVFVRKTTENDGTGVPGFSPN